MPRSGIEFTEPQTLGPEQEEAVVDVKQRLLGVLATAAALKASIEEHQGAVNEAGKVKPPAGFLFKLVALEDGAFTQVLDIVKSRSFQTLPAGAEFYAAGIVTSSLNNRDRLAVMVAHRPDRPTDQGYKSPLIISSPAFDVSLFPELDYDPRMNYKGRFGPDAPKWQGFPRGKIV